MYVSCKIYVPRSKAYRRLEGESTWEIWMVLGCVSWLLGFILWFVVQGPASVPLSLCFGALHCFAKSSDTCFCEILDDARWFLDEFLKVLISFLLIFERFKGSDGFVGAAVTPSSNAPLAFVSFPLWFVWVSKDTKVRLQWNRSEIDVKPKWIRSGIDVEPKWDRSETQVNSK